MGQVTKFFKIVLHPFQYKTYHLFIYPTLPLVLCWGAQQREASFKKCVFGGARSFIEEMGNFYSIMIRNGPCLV